MTDSIKTKIAKYNIRSRYTYAMRNLMMAHSRNENVKNLRHTVTGLAVPDTFNTKLTLHTPKDWAAIWSKIHVRVHSYLDNLRYNAAQTTSTVNDE